MSQKVIRRHDQLTQAGIAMAAGDVIVQLLPDVLDAVFLRRIRRQKMQDEAVRMRRQEALHKLIGVCRSRARGKGWDERGRGSREGRANVGLNEAPRASTGAVGGEDGSKLMGKLRQSAGRVGGGWGAAGVGYAVHAAIGAAGKRPRHSPGRTEDGLRTHGAAPTVGDVAQLAYFHGFRSTRSRLSGGVR